MVTVRLRNAAWSGLLIFFCASGCGGGSKPSVDSSTSSEANVKGVVKIDGVPASEGEIIFDPTNYQRKDVKPRTAPIAKDGTYTITTLTGSNEVRLGGSLVQKNQTLSSQSRAIDVQSGENTLDFDAKAK